jgi:hypothetical protein
MKQILKEIEDIYISEEIQTTKSNHDLMIQKSIKTSNVDKEEDKNVDKEEDKNVEKKEVENVDIIADFYQSGCFHILERIFLELDPKSKMACINVSPTWRKIIEFFFYQSTNPRYQVFFFSFKIQFTCLLVSLLYFQTRFITKII